ncbi:SGNH/GDSL hydrolase family protein [Bacillus pacificus]|uniref:SGNH/GDSL hydrolase family protein n=1 Tax=Bacillus pacificus TaxID=2026187 RepID=UPI003D65C1BF
MKLNRWGNTWNDRNFRNGTNDNWDRIEYHHNSLENKLDKGIAESTTNANIAKNQAEAANILATNLKKQVDELVKDGDSSVEAAQARVDIDGESSSTLQERLNTEQFRNEAAKTQAMLYAKFFRKLRKGQVVTITCLGDSMTYGHDTTSADKRPADPTVLPNGSKHTATRASISYPESLQSYLNDVFPGQATVINRGYSGDGVKLAYNRWTIPSGSDITLINFGINDSRASWIDYKGNVEEFLKWYERLIIRELKWGSAVIILMPPKLKRATDIDVDSFANSLDALARKYSIPVVDTETFTANCGQDIYSDDTHYNGKGYNIYGARMASIFMSGGKLFEPFTISNGSRILTRPTLDSCIYRSVNFSSSSGIFTPPEVNANAGIHAQINDGGAVYYTFYTDTEDMVIVPIFYQSLGAGSVDIYNYPEVNISLDFGVEQGYYTFGSLISGVGNKFVTPPSSVTSQLKTSAALNTISESGEFVKIHVATKGWHSLKIQYKQKNPTAYVLLHGLEILNYRSLESSLKSNGIIRGLTHAKYTDSIAIFRTTIKSFNLRNMMNLPEWGSEYYKGVPMKITVFNYDLNVIEYGFILHNDGITSANFGFKFLGELRRTNLTTNPTGFRTISNMTFDTNTLEYVIEWGDNVNRPTSFIIQPL